MKIESWIRRIQSEMDKRLLTQSELARIAGVSRQRVSSLLGLKSRSKSTVRALRKALELEEPDAPR